MPAKRRPPIPIETQVDVFFHGKWICYLCRRPTIFSLALKRLDVLVRKSMPGVPLAYWNLQWRRDSAPLLDELAACVDHIEAYSGGGAHEISNFAVVCARCNARKSNRSREDYLRTSHPWNVKGKYGEPTSWDGLSALFVVLARTSSTSVSTSERRWLAALERYFSAASPRSARTG
jgi:5-methylcytosine-specific restriction endonuclease McrA